MFGRKIPLFKLFGFQVNIDPSWFLLVILITWSLSAGLFPELYDDLSTTTYWLMGAAGALGLFISIVLHELGHSIVARRNGLEMRGITLFIFGGVAEMTDEPPSATAELYIAVAGPIVSVVLAMILLGLSLSREVLGLPTPVAGVIGYLGWINVILVGFNVLPAFPLDGGRVLRAVLWHVKGDLRWATKVTASIGGIFGLVLIALGVISAIGGNIIGGIWWVVLGIFLRGAASQSYQQVLIRRALEGEPVSRFMRTDLVTVKPDLSLRDFVDDFVYTYQHKLYPVVDNGALRGCVTISAVKDVPRDEWAATQIADVAASCSEHNTVTSDTDSTKALAKLSRNELSRLLVVDDGELVGIITLKDLLGFLSMKIDLEGESS